MKHTGLKLALRVCNVIIALICAAAIAGYFMFPLWKVDLKLTITDAVIEMVAPTPEEGEEGNPEETPAEDGDMLMQALGSLKGKNVSIVLPLEIQTMDVLNTVITQDKTLVNKIIDDNVNLLVDALTADMNTIVRPMAESVVKDVIQDQVKSQLRDSIAEGTDFDQMFADIGFDENIGVVFDALFAENANVESVTEAVMDFVKNTFDSLKGTEYDQGIEDLSTEQMEAIKSSVSEALSMLADENDNIDINNLLLNLLGSMDTNPNPEGGETSYVIYGGTLIAFAEENAPENEPQPEDQNNAELKAKVKALIMNNIGEQTDTIFMGVQILAIVVMVAMAVWAWLVLKMVLKFFAKNPGIGVGLPIWLGWIPAAVLCGIPNGALWLITEQSATLSSVVTDPTMMETIQTFGGVLQGSTFQSGAMVAAICAGVLFVFSFVNGAFRGKLKKAIKADKKADK